MIIERARVIAAFGGWATVEVDEIACATCAATAGCGVNRMGRFDSDGHARLYLRNTINARCGDLVELNVDNESLITAVLVAYGLPAIGLLLGVMLAGLIDPAGNTASVGALGGVFGGFLAARAAAMRAEPGVKLRGFVGSVRSPARTGGAFSFLSEPELLKEQQT